MASTLAVSVLATVGATVASAAAAEPDPASDRIDGQLVVLRAGEDNAGTKVGLPGQAEKDVLGAEGAQFIVNYDAGFDTQPQAKAAFQAAVDAWSTLIDSPVPIAVDAVWQPLAPGVLGAAGATNYYRNFSGAPQTSTWYPSALANKLAGTDLDSGASDIEAQFSSTFDWYFGTDGNTPPDRMDFMTVVMHEIGHGLGFAGSGSVQNGQGSLGAGTTSPFTWDRHVVDGNGAPLTGYPNPSSELATALQSGSLFWGGANAQEALGQSPELYAPATFEPGSSYSHLDEATYAPASPHSLMTPYLDMAESIHTPGPVALAMMKDTGWSLDTPVNPAEACEAATPAPSVVPNGLTNMGFETALDKATVTLADPWRAGVETDFIGRTDGDGFTAPYEGSWVAALGKPTTDSSYQPQGPNVLCQDFEVDQATEQFVYNIFTYDYTGYDDFRFNLTITDPDTDQILASYQQGAWGPSGDTSLKTSGWKGVTLDLAGHVGKTVRLSISAGGTIDTLYPFWVYLDSADQGLPPTVAAAGGATTGNGTGSVAKDPQTGEITISIPASQPQAVDFVAVATCPGGGDPDSPPVLVVEGGGQQEMVKDPSSGPKAYKATIPPGNSGVITVVVVCDGKTYVNTVGRIVLWDPSGYLTDAATGVPVRNAKVTLYNVPGWAPRSGPAENETPNTCETNESKAAGAAWSQPAPTNLGVVANPYADPQVMSPTVNPFNSAADGYYGWDVATGCWYVVVTHPGYQTKVSPVVGVPSEVTDLDLQLQPKTIIGTNSGPAFARHIKGLLSAGFTSGCTVTATTLDYCASAPVTRADMAIFLSRGMGGESFLQPYKGTFSDVPNGQYFTSWVERLADSGVTGGCSTNPPQYCPGQTVTRGQMAIFLLRAVGVQQADLPAYAGTFSDVPEFLPGGAVNFQARWIEELARRGVTTGTGGGQYSPDAPVTREQMAIFLAKTFGLPLPSA